MTAGATSSCLDAETIAAWVDRSLPSDEARAVEAHLADCARCQATVALTVRATPPPPVAEVWWKRRWVIGTLVPLAAGSLGLGLWIARPDRAAPRIAVRSISEPEPAAPDSAELKERVARADAPAAPTPDRQSEPEFRARDADTPAPPATVGTLADARRQEANDATALPPTVAQAPLRPPPPPSPAAAPVAAPADAGASVAPRARLSDQSVMAMAKAAAPVPTIEIVSSNPAVRWRIGDQGAIQYSTDGGGSWVSQPSGTTVALLAGSSPLPSVCWVVGRAGTILLWDGRAWQRVAARDSTDLIAVVATDADTATVTTADGRRLQTADSGRTWAPVQDF